MIKHKDKICMQRFEDSYEHKSPGSVYPGNVINLNQLYGFRGVGF